MKLPKYLRKKRFMLPAALVLVIALVLIFNSRDNQEEGEVKGEEIKKVEVLDIARRNSLTTTMNLKGTIVPREYVRLRSFVAADVDYLVPIGQEVNKGQVIVKLTDSRVEESYYSSLQALSDSQSNLQQTQALNSEALVQADLAVDSAEAALQLAHENHINTQQLASQDLKSGNNNARISYESSYNLMEQVLRFWSDGSLVDFVLEDALVANFELHQEVNEEFEFVVRDFNQLTPQADENLVLSLSKMEPVLERTKAFNDKIFRILNYAVSGNNFTQNDLELFKSQAMAFTSQLNAQNTALKSAIVGVETVQVTSRRSLDTSENQLRQAQINYDNALASFESAKRQAEIRELGARSQVSGNRSQYAAAEGQFEDLALRAPFDGIIIAHLVSEGDQVSMGETVIEMGDISGVEIELAIDEESGDLINVGQQVLINGDTTGIIEEISPSASIETGKVIFKVVAEKTGSLIPGDVAEVAVDLNYQLGDIIIVPLAYITVAQSENFVLVIDEGKVAKRTIKLARVYDSHVEVAEGLEEGDKIIVTNGEFLDIGENVEVK